MPAPSLTIFTDGQIIDGTGATRFMGDVAIREDRIVEVGAIDRSRANIINAAGLVIAPGFIDAHTHDDAALIITPDLVCKTSQGITSVVTGNCGASLAPFVLAPDRPAPPPLDSIGPPETMRFARFGDYLAALRAAPPAVNVAPLVGHGTLRAATMERLDQAATARERAAMRRLARDALRAGAIGVSSGLFYQLSCAAPADEVTDLVRLAGKVGGIYCAHIRDEADDVIAALDEAFTIARAAGTPLVVSHHKVSGRANFGRSRETLPHIQRAAIVQPLGFDMYPYTASSTSLNKKSWSAAERTIVTWSDPHPQHAGRDLADVAAEMALSEEDAIDALVPAGGVFFMMDDNDVERILGAGDAMIGSDGIPLDAHPHPRLWGSFTRVLGHYVRDRELFRLEEAVRRMTGLTARQFGLRDRGVIAPGAFADLVLFDPDVVADTATFADPIQASRGIASVWVNGERVWDGASSTGNRPGRILTRS